MASAFHRRGRVLCCAVCDGPVAVPIAGGTVTCDTCADVSSWPGIDPADEAPAPAPVGRDEDRMARLAAQDGVDLAVPPALAKSMKGGLGAVATAWRDARVAVLVSDSEAARERLYLCTIVFGSMVTQQGDLARLRRIYETAMEALPKGPWHWVLRGQLCRAAVVAGDLDAAQTWLDPIPRDSDNLWTHSARVAAECALATVKGDPDRVLELLGDELDAVPIANQFDETTELYRSHALEQVGRKDDAIEQLTLAMKRAQGATFDQMRKAAEPFVLCPGSYELAQAKAKATSPVMALVMTVVGSVPFLVFVPMMCAPGIFLRGCAPTPMAMALEQANDCPAVVDVLGADVHSTVGFGCGNLETGGGNGYLGWTVPVAGQTGRGSLAINASQHGGTWSVDRLVLTSGSAEIDVRGCLGTAEAP